MQLATYISRPDRSLEQIESMYPIVDSINEKGAPIKVHPNKYFVMMEKVQTDKDMAHARSVFVLFL